MKANSLTLKSVVKLFHTESFRHAFLLLVAGSLSVLFIIYIGYVLYPQESSEVALVAARRGINTELQKLVVSGNTVAAIPELVKAVASEDADSLATILPKERAAYGIGALSAANAQGVILSRTLIVNKKGDNVFLNGPLGRAMVSRNEPVAAVLTSTLDPRQLFISTGRFVYNNNQKVGAIFASQATDDTFAQTFAAKYLRGGEIAFYTKTYGIYGSSFSSPTTRKLLASYIYPESDWIQKGTDFKFLRTPDGHLFFVRNIVIPGLEGVNSGALVFVPLQYIWLAAILGIVVPMILFLLILRVVHRRLKISEKNLWWRYPMIIIFVVFHTLGVAALFALVFTGFPLLQEPPYPLYNSVLRFQPEGGVFDRRFAQKVSVVLDTGGEAINAIRLSIAYDPAKLAVQSVDMERSICVHFILSEHNSQTGHIEMECIIPNPGLKGSSAVVTDLFFKSTDRTNLASLNFLPDTQVLANDGLGTNVLRLTVDASLRFEDGSDSSGNNLIIFSPSHPNSERWYSNKKVILAWAPGLPGRIVDQADLGSVGPSGIPPLSKIITQDGIHTLTVIAKNSAGTDISSSLVVKIDTKPPEKVQLEASETKIKPGGIVRFRASGSDSLSGLQRVFYLKINDEIFFPIGQEIFIPFPNSGIYFVTLRVYDEAGNYTDTTQKIIVNRYQ